VVADDVDAEGVRAAVLGGGGDLLRAAEIFDVYRGEQVGAGKKSVALAAAFQSPDRTLSDEDAAKLRERVVAALGEQFGAELRA